MFANFSRLNQVSQSRILGRRIASKRRAIGSDTWRACGSPASPSGKGHRRQRARAAAGLRRPDLRLSAAQRRKSRAKGAHPNVALVAYVTRRAAHRRRKGRTKGADPNLAAVRNDGGHFANVGLFHVKAPYVVLS